MTAAAIERASHGGAEVAEVEVAEVEVLASTWLTAADPRIPDLLAGSAGLSVSDTHMAAEISAAITQRELALDYEHMFATAEPVSWRTRLEEVFTITAISWLPSSFVVGAIFLVADAVTEDGEAILLTTGAMVAMRRLYAAARDGYLPDRVFLAKGPRQTRSGYDVLILHRAP